LMASPGTLLERGGKNPGRRARARQSGKTQAADARAEVGGLPEASRKNTTGAEVCRRWGITPWQLRAIRERAKEDATTAFGRGPARKAKDSQVLELEGEVERTSRPLKELAIENTLLRGKVNGV
jgi:hypothetical protein